MVLALRPSRAERVISRKLTWSCGISCPVLTSASVYRQLSLGKPTGQ